MKTIFGIVKKIFARLLGFENKYISKVKGSNEWVYISYIPEVFYNSWNKKYMQGHQSRQEMIEMVKIFNKMGYNVFVSNFVHYSLPDINVKFVFGLEPGFINASKKYFNAYKIYYATGAYYGHQNKMIIDRTDEFNNKHHFTYPYQRLVKTYDHLNYADRILQIGSHYTVYTYPLKYQPLISTIHQSSTVAFDSNFEVLYAEMNEYIWIGGGGSILKGLDLIFDYFSMNTDKVVHIIGQIDKEFLSIYEDIIGNNIHIHGYMNINSAEFKSIISRCNYLIYPSCTEGCPGAVISAMSYGIIPVVSQWAAFDDIEDIGYLIENLTCEGINKIVSKIENLDKETVLLKKQICRKYVFETYNLQRFSEEFTMYFKGINK